MKIKRAVLRQQRGSVTILMVGALVALIAFVGLALDVGVGYLARAKLSTAVDGAALAASRALAQGRNQTERIRNAERTAQAFFSSTFPEGTLGMHVLGPQTKVVFDPIDGTRITVSAQAEGSVSFLRVLGFSALPIAASAETRHSSVDLMMVTDMSGSILNTPNWKDVVKDSLEFFERLSPQGDRAAQVVYGDKPYLLVPFRQAAEFDMNAMRAANQKMMIGVASRDLVGYVGGQTATAPALAMAIDQLHKITSPAPNRVLLLFTDGMPNRICDGPVVAGCKVINDPDGHPITSVKQVAEQTKLALGQGIKVFVIGFGQGLTDPNQGTNNKTGETWLVEALNLQDKDSAEAADPTLKSGLYCAANDAASLQRCYEGYGSELLRLSK